MNHEQLENELYAMGFGNCGHNGDWSVSAWQLSSMSCGKPNWDDGGIYLLDSEDGTYSVVQRFYIDLTTKAILQDDNDRIETLIEFDSTHTVLVWMQVFQMFCQNKPYPMLPFESEGMSITDPTMDETGRFEVDPDYYKSTIDSCDGCNSTIDVTPTPSLNAECGQFYFCKKCRNSCDGCGSSAIVHTYQNQSFCVDCCNAAIQTGELANCVKCGGYVNDADVCCGVRFDGAHPYKV